MLRKEKVYTSLCALLAVVMVAENLVYQKFVDVSVFGLLQVQLSVGAIIYPVTFMISDVTTELFGADYARYGMRQAMCLTIFTSLLVMLMAILPATSWSRVDQETFIRVFGLSGVGIFASVVAGYIAQSVDIAIYSRMKAVTSDRYLWLRSNVSMLTSLLVDTACVLGILCAFGVFPMDQWFNLVKGSFSYKAVFAVCSTPLFYLVIRSLKKLI
ncbi:MAG: queuosine precursor transporter [Pseudomonadota bacterium]